MTHKKLDMHFPAATMAADCLIQRPQKQWFAFRPCLCHGIKENGTQSSITFWSILSRRMWHPCIQFLNLCFFSSKTLKQSWNIPSEMLKIRGQILISYTWKEAACLFRQCYAHLHWLMGFPSLMDRQENRHLSRLVLCFATDLRAT